MAYGTEIPGYRLEYSFRPGENGDILLEGKLTQSGVSGSAKPDKILLSADHDVLADKNEVATAKPSAR